MLKKILFILSFLLISPVFAGELEDASISNTRIFLYMYTPECGYCQKFDENYNKLANKYGKDCKFLKINANTTYGYSVMRRLSAFYIPFVVLLNNQKQTMQRIDPTCLLEYACVKDAVDKFVK